MWQRHGNKKEVELQPGKGAAKRVIFKANNDDQGRSFVSIWRKKGNVLE